MFFALAIPLDDPTSTMSVALFFEAEYDLPTNLTEIDLANDDAEFKRDADRQRRKRTIDRAIVYAMLESKFESLVTRTKYNLTLFE